MKHSVCLIDNAIPANQHPEFIDDTKILEKSILKYLHKNSDWEEDPVKNLVGELVKDDGNWNVSAFKDPSFFFSHRDEVVFSPEIILYDWDYGQGAGSDKPENDLLTILNSTYAIVNIFTGADKDDEVSKIIADEKFKKFSDRLRLIKKDEDEAVPKLLQVAKDRWDSNFSYQFGNELKKNALKSLEKILVQISKLSVEQFVAFFGSKTNNGQYKISTNTLVSIISEKFKHELLNQKFIEKDVSVQTDLNEDDEGLIKAIWAYRLYYKPHDNIVRKGDIIKRVGDERRFLVLSSDCHLNQFWNKNFGYVSLVPLYKLENDNEEIKEKFNSNKQGKLKQFNLTSLTNPNQVEGITILPGIFDDQICNDYLLNPKEIFTVKIPLPGIKNIQEIKTNLPLYYDFWQEYDGENRLAISEPFKSPLIEFIMDNISGYGCPDFPEPLSKSIIKNFKQANGIQ